MRIILFFFVFTLTSWALMGKCQQVIGIYYENGQADWHLVEIEPSTGIVDTLGTIDGLKTFDGLNSSFVANSSNLSIHFFGYDSNDDYRFYSVSMTDAEIFSSPLVDEGGWGALSYNVHDSMLYVRRGFYDNLGTDILKFTNVQNGSYEHVQHFELEGTGPGDISSENVFVTQAVEFTTGIPDGKYYSMSLSISDSTQSFEVECDYVSPEFMLHLRYHPVTHEFYALMGNNDVQTLSLVSFEPTTGQTQLISDLDAYESTSGTGGILYEEGYYIFTGTYVGDTVYRVISVDIETGQVVNDPPLSSQVHIRTIDINQTYVNGIGEANVVDRNLTVFPNPATEIIRFEVKGSAEYQVLDVFGKVIFQGRARTNQQTTVDVSGLAAGVYYLRTEHSAASFVIAR